MFNNYTCNTIFYSLENECTPLHKQKKYIVFEDCLLSLFTHCRVCGGVTSVSKKTLGTYLHIEQQCSLCSSVFTWDSQPWLKNRPAGNILLSASILFSGALPTKTLQVLNTMGCATHSERTFFQHQQHYLHYCISTVYEKHQTTLLSKLRKEKEHL